MRIAFFLTLAIFSITAPALSNEQPIEVHRLAEKLLIPHAQALAAHPAIKVELDQSSGVNQIQVSVPIMHGSCVIGSLVVGAEVAKL